MFQDNISLAFSPQQNKKSPSANASIGIPALPWKNNSLSLQGDSITKYPGSLLVMVMSTAAPRLKSSIPVGINK